MAKKDDIFDVALTKAVHQVQIEGLLEGAQIFLRKNKIIYCMEEKCFYRYDGKYYKKSYDEEIHGLLIEDEFVAMLAIAKRDVISRNIRILARINIDKFNSQDCLCMDNGILYPKDNRLIPHTPDIINTIRLPYEFNPEARCPLWEKSLDEIFENDKNKIRVLQEFIGYCLTRETHFEKALMFIGDGRNGKSTVLSVIESLVGEENCAALPLKYLDDPQHACLLLGKYININSEFGGKYVDFEDAFKTIVSGEAISVNPKYATMFRYRPFCKMIFAVNNFPHIEDKTGALYSRLMIISFDRIFKQEEQNKQLKYQLKAELSGVLNWAITGLQRLTERQDFAIDEYMKKVLLDLKSFNNPLFGFIDDCIDVTPGVESIKSDVYREYKEWCALNGFKPYGVNKFGMEFFRLLKGKIKDSKETWGERRRTWVNIKLVNGKSLPTGWQE